MVEFIPEPFINSQDCQDQGGVWFECKGCLLGADPQTHPQETHQPLLVTAAPSKR